jgi:hypothetical protein
MEPRVPLQCAQELATDPYPAPDESSPQSYIFNSLISILLSKIYYAHINILVSQVLGQIIITKHINNRLAY